MAGEREKKGKGVAGEGRRKGGEKASPVRKGLRRPKDARRTPEGHPKDALERTETEELGDTEEGGGRRRVP
jgi:hypothetical protein